MEFKQWLEGSGYDDHDILVSHGPEELALHPAEVTQARDFSYSKEDGYETTFRVMPMKSQRRGHAHDPAGRADFMGVLLFTRVRPGKGTDVAFIKSLSSRLASQGGGVRPVPYKNVGLGMFGGLLKSAAEKMGPSARGELQKRIEASKDKDFRNSMETPDFSSGASNTVGVGKSISVGSASWSFFFEIGRRGSASHYVDMVVGLMKDSLKPFMDNGLVHGYRITTGRGVEVESGSSAAGEDEDSKTEREVKTNAGYIKFLARTMLSGRAREMVVGRMDYALRALGWRPEEVKETDARVDMGDLARFARQIDSELLAFFVEAVKDDDDNKYEVIRGIAEDMKEGWRSGISLPEDALVYYYRNLVDDGWADYLGSPISYADSVLECLENEEFFERVARNDYNAFKSEYKERLAEDIRRHGGRYLGRHERESLAKLLGALGLEGSP